MTPRAFLLVAVGALAAACAERAPVPPPEAPPIVYDDPSPVAFEAPPPFPDAPCDGSAARFATAR